MPFCLVSKYDKETFMKASTVYFTIYQCLLSPVINIRLASQTRYNPSYLEAFINVLEKKMDWAILFRQHLCLVAPALQPVKKVDKIRSLYINKIFTPALDLPSQIGSKKWADDASLWLCKVVK